MLFGVENLGVPKNIVLDGCSDFPHFCHRFDAAFIVLLWSLAVLRVVMPLADDSSDESQSDSVSETDDADLRSTTSLEDMARLTSNMLLYKAARARNIAVMLDALAQFADINWRNNDDYGRTPLMQAIFGVCMPSMSMLV